MRPPLHSLLISWNPSLSLAYIQLSSGYEEKGENIENMTLEYVLRADLSDGRFFWSSFWVIHVNMNKDHTNSRWMFKPSDSMKHDAPLNRTWFRFSRIFAYRLKCPNYGCFLFALTQVSLNNESFLCYIRAPFQHSLHQRSMFNWVWTTILVSVINDLSPFMNKTARYSEGFWYLDICQERILLCPSISNGLGWMFAPLTTCIFLAHRESADVYSQNSGLL